MSSTLPAVENLSARVWRVLGLNPGLYTLQGTNTYVIGTGKNRLLLDTGEANREDYCELLASTLKKLNANISKIVISHWHHDHLGGLPLVLGSVCREHTPTVYKLPLPQHQPSLSYPLRGEVVHEPPSEEGMTYLRDGEMLEVEGARVEVIATPGHTQDHLSLWLEEEQTIFTADCILGEGSAVFEALGPYMSSLEKLLKLHPVRLFPGHGPVVEDGSAWIEHYLSHRRARERQVIDCLKEYSVPVTARQIVQVVYKDVHKDLWTGAESNVRHHLEKLLQEGKVQLLDNKWMLSSKL